MLGAPGLRWLKVDLPVQVPPLSGLAFLLFLSVLEIEPRRVRRPFARAALIGERTVVAWGGPIDGGHKAACRVQDTQPGPKQGPQPAARRAVAGIFNYRAEVISRRFS